MLGPRDGCRAVDPCLWLVEHVDLLVIRVLLRLRDALIAQPPRALQTSGDLAGSYAYCLHVQISSKKLEGWAQPEAKKPSLIAIL